MCAPIYFDEQPRHWAGEVAYVRPDRVLASKAHSEWSFAQSRPEDHFSIGHPFTERSGESLRSEFVFAELSRH